MTVNTAFWNAVASLQKSGQFHKRPHLPGGRGLMIEITHQTNPHGIPVGPVACSPAAMGTCDLIVPAKSHFNLSVTTVSTVAYNKIVTNTLPVVTFSVPLVEYGDIAVVCPRMMYHYSCPSPFRNRRRHPAAGINSTNIHHFPPWG